MKVPSLQSAFSYRSGKKMNATESGKVCRIPEILAPAGDTEERQFHQDFSLRVYDLF
ncbi:hypothetical protein [Methanomethylovorans sp.]|uniref:hypothetical protein n=1 Tax=Methanomethylovorans sp. TaxID=2758717 RepID=UPI001BD214A3